MDNAGNPNKPAPRGSAGPYRRVLRFSATSLIRGSALKIIPLFRQLLRLGLSFNNVCGYHVLVPCSRTKAVLRTRLSPENSPLAAGRFPRARRPVHSVSPGVQSSHGLADLSPVAWDATGFSDGSPNRLAAPRLNSAQEGLVSSAPGTGLKGTRARGAADAQGPSGGPSGARPACRSCAAEALRERCRAAVPGGQILART